MEECTKKHTTWIAIAVILVAGWIATGVMGLYGLVQVKHGDRQLDVVGSARKQVRSDLGVWSGTFSAQAPTMAEAYTAMTRHAGKVKAYMAARGFSDKEIVFSAISTTINHVMDAKGRETSKIESYKLTQSVEVSSADVDKVADTSRKATELINDGIDFQSGTPRYFYTRIADLKLEVLSMASLDAKARADRIAQNTGTRAGSLTSAVMGVFQINALNSTETSDMGVYDTTTIDKEISAIVMCKFDIGR